MYSQLLQSIFALDVHDPQLEEYLGLVKTVYDESDKSDHFIKSEIVSELGRHLDQSLGLYSEAEWEPKILEHWRELRQNNFNPELYDRYPEMDSLAESALRDYVTYKLNTVL